MIIPRVIGQGDSIAPRSAYEIVSDRANLAAALIVLVGTPTGLGPADVTGAFPGGRWAGRPVAFIGELTEPPSGANADAFARIPKSRPYNRAHEARAAVEAACDVRFHRFKTPHPLSNQALHHAVHLDRHGDGTPYAAEVPDPTSLCIRQNMPTDISEITHRAPAGDLRPVTATDVHDGERRVLVSLDAGQFVDPARLGDVPTLAGMARGSSRTALSLLLLEHAHRAPGDIRTPGGLQGAWRGHRVAAPGSPSADGLPGARDVVEAFTDVTDAVRDLLTANNLPPNPTPTCHELARTLARMR